MSGNGFEDEVRPDLPAQHPELYVCGGDKRYRLPNAASTASGVSGEVRRYCAAMAEKHYVYLYTTIAGAVMYVGYGANVERALSHSGGSHNKQLKAWLARENFDLKIAGPYASEQEAKHVEAAIISGIKPKFNVAPGEGPKFRPLGVPGALGDRPSASPLSLAEIGRLTGGALLVYLAPGTFLRDGRKKFNAADPQDKDVLANMEGTSPHFVKSGLPIQRRALKSF